MIGDFLTVKINPMSEFELQLAVKKEKLPTIKGPGIFWGLIILMLMLLGLAVTLLGKNDAGATLPTPSETVPVDTRQPRIYTVSYRSGVFSPTNLRIHAGDTVRFKNEGLFGIRIVSQDIVGFDSIGDIPQGSYFSFTFAARGIFEYHNQKNSKETGTIIVR